MAATIGVAALTHGGGDDELMATDQPSAPTSNLVLSRPDGSTYTFTGLTVSCVPPKFDDDADATGNIWLTSPRDLSGTGIDRRLVEPFIYFKGTVADLQGVQTFDIPIDHTGPSDELPFILFAADSRGGPRDNEVSSDEFGAAGTVRVLQASCDPTPVLELEVHATLGSEVEQNPLAVSGSFH